MSDDESKFIPPGEIKDGEQQPAKVELDQENRKVPRMLQLTQPNQIRHNKKKRKAVN